MRNFVLFSMLSVWLLLASAEGQKTSNKSELAPASPQAVCGFISAHLTSSVPQVTTLCSAKQDDVPGYYKISIFSPKGVLESDNRRAWSSALFQAFQELTTDPSMNGACSTRTICEVSIMDANMAQHYWHYGLFSIKDAVASVQAMNQTLQASDFSDPWYLTWWNVLLAGIEVDHPSSKENAQALGERACTEYVSQLKRHPPLPDRPIPTCSILLATDKAIYLVLDFADASTAALSRSAAIPMLINTFGRLLDGTAYTGEIVFRSPWMNTKSGDWRSYQTIPLRQIEFAFEEIGSGLRTEADADFLLEMRYEGHGQVSIDNLLTDSDQGFVVRNVAVVRYISGANSSIIMDTTDGAEWSITLESSTRCGIAVGAEVFVSATTGNRPTLSVDRKGNSCKLDADFVKGW